MVNNWKEEKEDKARLEGTEHEDTEEKKQEVAEKAVLLVVVVIVVLRRPTAALDAQAEMSMILGKEDPK